MRSHYCDYHQDDPYWHKDDPPPSWRFIGCYLTVILVVFLVIRLLKGAPV